MKELKFWLTIFLALLSSICIVGPISMIHFGIWSPETISWNRVLIINCIACLWSTYRLIDLFSTKNELEVRNEAVVKQLVLADDVVKWATNLQSEEQPHACPDLVLRAMYREKTREAIKKYHDFCAKNG